MTQIGLMIEGQDGLNWTRWKRILTTAEDAGYQCVFRSDHFTNPQGEYKDALDLWSSLTVAATHTQRIEFGPLVSPVTFRHPSLTFKYASAVDQLSNGRLVMGLGAGWQEREHTNFGIPFYDFPTRFQMLREQLAIGTHLVRQPEPLNFEGEHYTLTDARMMPRRSEPMKILVGGNGPKKTLPLAAQYADEWNAVYADFDMYRERTERLNQLLAEQGREPASVKRSLMTRVIYGQDDAALNAKLQAAGIDKTPEELRTRGLVVGTANAIIDQLGKWAELGVQRFMLQWLELDNVTDIELMAQDVLPHFHN